MHKRILLVLFIGMAAHFSEASNADTFTDNSKASLVASYVSTIFSSGKFKTFGYIALAGLGIYGLYKLAMHAMQQEEERLFDEHQQDLEDLVVSKKDFGIINDFIDAMESDVKTFEEQPLRVQSMALSGFDNEDLASGCEGIRDLFCMAYEQCHVEAENKDLLVEIINIFRQTLQEKMIVAELPL